MLFFKYSYNFEQGYYKKGSAQGSETCPVFRIRKRLIGTSKAGFSRFPNYFQG